MTVASRAVVMAVMTEVRTTDVEQEGYGNASHWVVVTSEVVLVAGDGGIHLIDSEE